MACRIHEKAARLLRERGFKKKELAQALGVSLPQLDQLLEGRVPFDLSHLKGLVEFFGIRADFWIDETRDDPRAEDVVERPREEAVKALEKLGIQMSPREKAFREKVRKFLLQHPEEWTALFGPLTREEMELLGLDQKDREA